MFKNQNANELNIFEELTLVKRLNLDTEILRTLKERFLIFKIKENHNPLSDLKVRSQIKNNKLTLQNKTSHNKRFNNFKKIFTMKQCISKKLNWNEK